MTKNILQKMIGSKGAWLLGIAWLFVGIITIYSMVGSIFDGGNTSNYSWILLFPSILIERALENLREFGNLIFMAIQFTFGFILGYIIEINFFKKRRRR